MASLKLDDEFGGMLAGAGSRPAFANLVKYQMKGEEGGQREFPTTLHLKGVRVQLGVNPGDVDESMRTRANDNGTYCLMRIASSSFKTPAFKPDGGQWTGQGDIQFMLASSASLFVKVTIQAGGEQTNETTYGFARVPLASLGEGEFETTSEIKESEYVTAQDEVLGYLTVSYGISPNFNFTVAKLDNQYDTKNLPALINIIPLDSKTLGTRMGAFQGALTILQNIVAEMLKQRALGPVASKQLSVILNQASSAQGVELFEDLLWDMANLSFASHIFEPSLAFFPTSTDVDMANESAEAVGDIFTGGDGKQQVLPFTFALHDKEKNETVVLVAESETDFLRWTAVLSIACAANSEVNTEKVKKMTIPDYCKDPAHPGHPTVGWLKRKKAAKKALTSDYVRRFFKLACDEDMHYTLVYGHDPKDVEDFKAATSPKKGGEEARSTKVPIREGTTLVLPCMLQIPTPFALQIQIQNVSDFSFQSCESIRVMVQMGHQRQLTGSIKPKEKCQFNTSILLPVAKDKLSHANSSMTTANIGWFGEEFELPRKIAGAASPNVEFSVVETVEDDEITGKVADVTTLPKVAKASVPFQSIPFGRLQEMSLPLEVLKEGVETPGAAGSTTQTSLSVGITMRRLGQYKTAWPAHKVRIIQSEETCERDIDKWEGPCLVRAAPQGLEIFNSGLSPDEAGMPVVVVDYYSIEAITAINRSTLDIAIIIEKNSCGKGGGPAGAGMGGLPSSPSSKTLMDYGDMDGDSATGHNRRFSFYNTSPSNKALNKSPKNGGHGGGPPGSPNSRRRSSFGMVSNKGRTLGPQGTPIKENGGGGGAFFGLTSPSSTPPSTPKKGGGGDGGDAGAAANGGAGGAPPTDYFILRISPCPAETLKDLVKERKWMFRDRSMLLYITHKLHQIQVEEESPEGTGPVSSDQRTLEKLAVASSETYKRIKGNMSEVVKTANWKHARGVGFTEEHIRMFFRLQRLSCYFSKLVESRARPLWGIEEDGVVQPRQFARKDLDRIFSSQYVQAGTFGAEAQGIENSVKGVGHALKGLHRRLDEVKLFYHEDPEGIQENGRIFFQEYFLRCIGELGAHVMSDEVLHEVPIEVVVAFVCFLVKRDKAFHELLVENSLEPDRNAFLTTILSIDSMIRRLTKRTELEIVAQWPKEGEIGEDAGSYITSLLGDCSPDALGMLSTRAPQELMRLLEKYVQLISSQCRARGNLGAKIFEGMFFALPSYASNAADTIFNVNHTPSAWNSVRYLTAILNDMSSATDLMEELLVSHKDHLEGIPISTEAVRTGIFSSGVEVSCLVADIALLGMDEVCSEFFQAEWYADDDSGCMRKACKLLCRKMDELEGMVHPEPFFQYVVEAGVQKISFRYLKGFTLRATDASGGKMMAAEEVDRVKADITTMETYLKKYGTMVETSLAHMKEMLAMLTEPPEILQQAVFVDILKRHEGKEQYVMQMLKTCTSIRDDLRNFYVPAWINKLKQKMTAIVSERQALEAETDGRSGDIVFDIFEWVFTTPATACVVTAGTRNDAGYIYRYLMTLMKAAAANRAAGLAKRNS